MLQPFNYRQSSKSKEKSIEDKAKKSNRAATGQSLEGSVIEQDQKDEVLQNNLASLRK
jgi:hypothetical protein